MPPKVKVSNRLLGAFLRILPQEFKRRLGVHLGVPDLRWSLMQLRRFGFTPMHVMDVGAFKGDWARVCLSVFPEATITCIEPQNETQRSLQKLAREYSNIKVIQTLLGGSERGNVIFQEIGQGSSVLFDEGDTKITSSMTTIDSLIESGLCEPPELIKLDVNGYEIEVLKGWTKKFEFCQVIQSEINLLPSVPGTPLLHEVVAYFYERGFVFYDIEEFIRAPSDGTVWLIDAFFCRIDSPLRKERVWRLTSSNI